jgi:hypothetical protein
VEKCRAKDRLHNNTGELDGHDDVTLFLDDGCHPEMKYDDVAARATDLAALHEMAERMRI